MIEAINQYLPEGVDAAAMIAIAIIAGAFRRSSVIRLYSWTVPLLLGAALGSWTAYAAAAADGVFNWHTDGAVVFRACLVNAAVPTMLARAMVDDLVLEKVRSVLQVRKN